MLWELNVVEQRYQAGRGVLADPLLAGVHQRGDLPGVRAALGVGGAGELRGPRGGRQRDERAGAAADPGVDDGGDVAGAGQVPLADRVGENLPGLSDLSSAVNCKNRTCCDYPGRIRGAWRAEGHGFDRAVARRRHPRSAEREDPGPFEISWERGIRRGAEVKPCLKDAELGPRRADALHTLGDREPAEVASNCLTTWGN
jgi:hypothetical protein